MKKLLHVYIFLFIFTMFNRVFKPLIDLRFIIIPLGTILVMLGFINISLGKMKVKIYRIYLYIILFYIIAFASNINWLNTSLIMDKQIFNNLNILYLYNFLAIIIFILYRKFILFHKLKYYIVISGIFLIASILLVYIGVDIKTLVGDNTRTFTLDVNKNFLGSNMRVSGFAEDANYTSFLMIILITNAIQFIKNKAIKYTTVVLSIYCYMAAASKTVLAAVVIGLILIFIKNKILQKCVSNIILFSVFFVPSVIIKLNLYTPKSDTMIQRFWMWKDALDLSEKNLILGSGLSSFRSYFQVNYWYVQSHSTIFQVLSENGIIALIILFIIYKILLNNENKTFKLLICIFIILNLNFELVYLAFFPFMICLLPLICINNNDKNLGKMVKFNE